MEFNTVNTVARIFIKYINLYFLPAFLVFLVAGSVFLKGGDGRPLYDRWNLPDIYYYISWILIPATVFLWIKLFHYAPKNGSLILTDNRITIKNEVDSNTYLISTLDEIVLNVRPPKLFKQGFKYGNFIEIKDSGNSIKLEFIIAEEKDREEVLNLMASWKETNPNTKRTWV